MSEQVFGEQLLSICLEKVTKLLSDDAYFARRQAACFATVLYHKWTRPQASKLTLTQDIAWHTDTKTDAHDAAAAAAGRAAAHSVLWLLASSHCPCDLQSILTARSYVIVDASTVMLPQYNVVLERLNMVWCLPYTTKGSRTRICTVKRSL